MSLHSFKSEIRSASAHQKLILKTCTDFHFRHDQQSFLVKTRLVMINLRLGEGYKSLQEPKPNFSTVVISIVTEQANCVA